MQKPVIIATAVAAFVVFAQAASVSNWVSTRPAVISQPTVLPNLATNWVARNQQQIAEANRQDFQLDASFQSNPTATGGWLALGAGISFLVMAAYSAFRRSTSVPLQSLVVTFDDPKVALMSTSGAKAPPANLKLHVYDHCPYCTRVELFLGWNGVKYERILYGYGDQEGPKKLTGKKQLPVLEGDGVWTPLGMNGLPESLDIIAWAAQEYGLVIPPATGRKDIDDWQKRAKAPIAALSRPRMIKMPYRDFQKPEDIEYAFGKWAKKTGFVAEEALAATPELLVEMEALLVELEGKLKGVASLNAWGLGMDDILLLPDLRRLTCVKGLKWPSKLKYYVDRALSYPAMQCVSYEKYAF